VLRAYRVPRRGKDDVECFIEIERRDKGSRAFLDFVKMINLAFQGVDSLLEMFCGVFHDQV
jgi:hypothetical protein